MTTLNRRSFVTALALAGIGASTRAAAQSGTPESDRPLVAVSTPLLADIVQRTAGDAIEAYAIMPVNADPHTWEARPQDMTKIADVDAFIFIGAFLEPFIETGGWRRAVRDSGAAQLEVAPLVDLIVVDQVIDHGDHTHDLRSGDPHFWQDPARTMQAVEGIRDFLVELAPAAAETILASAEAYLQELATLDTELTEAYVAIPQDRRKLVVFHDAFRYFAEKYAFSVSGVVLKNPQAEVSAGELAEIQETMEREQIDVVFAEPQYNTDVLSVMAEEQGYTVAPLLSDTFADPVASYTDLMRFNRDSIVEHLG